MSCGRLRSGSELIWGPAVALDTTSRRVPRLTGILRTSLPSFSAGMEVRFCTAFLRASRRELTSFSRSQSPTSVLARVLPTACCLLCSSLLIFLRAARAADLLFVKVIPKCVPSHLPTPSSLTPILHQPRQPPLNPLPARSHSFRRFRAVPSGQGRGGGCRRGDDDD